ncbi:MAG: hypothetical protein AAFR76_03690 [Planctomycetota bacterium]
MEHGEDEDALLQQLADMQVSAEVLGRLKILKACNDRETYLLILETVVELSRLKTAHRIGDAEWIEIITAAMPAPGASQGYNEALGRQKHKPRLVTVTDEPDEEEMTEDEMLEAACEMLRLSGEGAADFVVDIKAIFAKYPTIERRRQLQILLDDVEAMTTPPSSRVH